MVRQHIQLSWDSAPDPWLIVFTTPKSLPLSGLHVSVWFGRGTQCLVSTSLDVAMKVFLYMGVTFPLAGFG